MSSARYVALNQKQLSELYDKNSWSPFDQISKVVMSSDEQSSNSKNGDLLTEEQKRAHHIASEQRRRENIRSEFDRIVQLTPSLSEEENRSELNILSKSADYIDSLKEENKKLIQLCHEKGITVPDQLIYEGPDASNV